MTKSRKTRGPECADAADTRLGGPADFPERAFPPNARAGALVRGLRAARIDLDEAGGAYGLAEVQTLLGGVTGHAVEMRVRSGSILTVPGTGKHRVYPAIQFGGDGRTLAD